MTWAVYGCGVYPENPQVPAPGLIACGLEDEDRLRISRDFVYRCREAGGSLIWYPAKGGHELNDCARQLTRAFFAAAASKNVCTLWGEDDTRRVLPCAQIDVEFRNPLYTNEIVGLWRR